MSFNQTRECEFSISLTIQRQGLSARCSVATGQGKHFKEGDKRTAGEVAAEAPINTGTAGQDTPALQGQQNNPSPVKLRIPTTGKSPLSLQLIWLSSYVQMGLMQTSKAYLAGD